jgi:TPR repeat protein
MSAKSEQLEQELEEVEDADEVCASCSCGIAAVDEVKLKDCDGGCILVKYCSDECKENYSEQHKEECKKRVDEMSGDVQRRADELHNKKLFTQPDISHRGECSICCLPLPLDVIKSRLMSCCCKYICNGCFYVNREREVKDSRLEQRCAFCREPLPDKREKALKKFMERVKKNDPAAMTQMGKKYDHERDYRKALQYWTKAADLGCAEAHFSLGSMHDRGIIGVEKDMEKAVYHLEQAAIDGHPGARVFLASYEIDNSRFERAAKHYIIAANLGCDISLKLIKDFFVEGVVSKEEYAAALRGYQAAVDATKSSERDEGEVMFQEEFKKFGFGKQLARRN